MEEEVRVALNDLKNLSTCDGFGEEKRSGKETAKIVYSYLISVDDNEFDVVSATIADGEFGLLDILSDVLANESLKEVAGVIMDALAVIVQRCSVQLLKRLVERAQKLALKAIQSSRLQSQRKTAFSLLTEIVKRTESDLEASTIEVGTIVRVCRNDSDDNKLPDGVRNMMYQLMGALCRYLPQETSNHAQFFIKVVLSDLQKQISNSFTGPANQIIEGCFVALDGMLVHFEKEVKEQRIRIEKIFGFIKVILNPENGMSRFDPVRAAIALLTNHVEKFLEFVYMEYRVVYEYLAAWCMKSDQSLKHGAMNCIDVLMEQISATTPTYLKKDRKNTEVMMRFFLEKYTWMFEVSTEPRTVARAVKGLGFFAEAEKLMSGDEALASVLSKILNRGMQLYLGNVEESLESRITFLSQFLEAFARILKISNQLPSDDIAKIQSLHVLYLQHFPMLDTKYHYLAGKVSYWLILAARAHHSDYCSRLVRTALIHMASHQPSGLPETNKSSFDDYVLLWKLLLNSHQFQGKSPMFSDREINSVPSEISGGLARSLIDISERLSFDLMESDDQRKLPKNVEDFRVFVNLTTLFIDLLPSIPSAAIVPWIQPLVVHFVAYATEHKHVSSFNNILASILQRANSEGYWKQDKQDALVAIQNYIQDSSACKKGDLLIGSINVLLALPHKLVVSELQIISSAMVTALKLGLSYLTLADVCLSALESWTSSIELKSLEPMLKQVLPSLDAFLQAGDVKETESALQKNRMSFASKKRKYQLMQRKKRPVSEEIRDNDLDSIKRRIVLLLGGIGEMREYLIAKPTVEFLAEQAAWDSQPHLKYPIPFPDAKPELQLDFLLPRISELALEAPDRPRKIAACEALHSCVIYVLGTHSARSGPESVGKPMERLYQKLFPVLLQLCCDSDEVPRQMFRPLLEQIIHWFTSSSAKTELTENPESMALLHSIWEVLIDPDNTADRKEFAGYCLNEFLRWTLKQSEKVSRYRNTKSVLKRLCDYASHPSSSKRLGAAIGFNAIYATLRENFELMDCFILEIAEYFLYSLAKSDGDDITFGSGKECSAALDHILKIICQPKIAKGLCEPGKERRSKTFPLGEITLKLFLHWLLEQMGNSEMLFRRKCLDFVGRIAEIPELKTFFNNEKKLISVGLLEGKETIYGGIHVHNEPERAVLGDSYSSVFAWMKALLAALDCHSSISQPPFAVGNFIGKGSHIERAISYYLKEFGTVSAHEYFAGCRSFKELRKFDELRSNVAVSIFQFLKVLLRANVSLNFVWNSDLFQFFLSACIKPASLGFDVSNAETNRKLQQLITSFAQNSKKSPEFNKLECFVEREALKHLDVEKMLGSFHQNSSKDHCGLIQGFITLIESNLISWKNPAWKIGDRIWSILQKTVLSADYSPEHGEFAKLCLDFALRLDLKISTVVQALLDKSETERGVKKGQFLCTQLTEAIMKSVGKSPALWMDELCPDRIEFLVSLLEDLGRNKELRSRHGQGVVKEVLNYWDQFTSFGLEKTKALMLAQLLEKVFLLDTTIITNKERRHPKFSVIMNFFLDMLMKNDKKVFDLNFKNKFLKLLGIFAVNTSSEEELKLRKALELVCTNHLPFRSDEFHDGTSEQAEYLDTIRKFLAALSISNSPVILETIIQIMCRERKHVAEEEITKHLKSYAAGLDPQQSANMVNKLLGIFLGTDMSAQLRRNTLDKILLPVLAGVPDSTASAFFSLNLKKITTPIERVLVSDTEEEFTLRTGCFKLLEVLYRRVSPEVLKGTLNQQFSGGDPNKNLQRHVSKIAKDGRVIGKDENNSLKLEYRCAAHNCLVALITATQNDPKFYKLLFQKEVWGLITDQYNPPSFPEEYEYTPDRKKQLLDLSSSNVHHRQISLYFLSSQTLSQSSLSSELSNHDFIKPAPLREPSTTDDSIELEDNDLNRNPCVFNMLKGIKNAFALEPGSTAPPEWMTWLKSAFEEQNGPGSGKVLLAHVIVLLEPYFKTFAEFWLLPLLNLALDTGSYIGGDRLHQFRVDLIVTLLGWTPIAIPEDTHKGRQLCLLLLNYLLGQIANSTSSLVKRNLSLLNSVCECWGKRIVPDEKTWSTLRRLGNDSSDRERTIWIEIMGILLQNDLQPFPETEKMSAVPKLATVLRKEMNKPSAKVYKPAAEVLGLLFQSLKNSQSSVESLMEKLNLTENVLGMRLEKFAQCGHAIQRHFPLFSSKIGKKALGYLNTAPEGITKQLLEIVTSSCSFLSENDEHPFVTFRYSNSGGLFNRLLTSQNEDIILACLQLLAKSIKGRSSKELQEIVEKVGIFVNHSSSVCRAAAANLAMDIFSNIDKSDQELRDNTKSVLIRFLGDSDVTIKQKMYNFWTHQTRLSRNSVDRVVEIVHNLYSPESEDEFLSYACYLLFERCSEAPDFERPIFSAGPLKQCNFENLQIDINWRSRNASLGVPLFAESQSYVPEFSQRPEGSGELLGTQNTAAFSQTQKEGYFDWLSGESVPDTYEPEPGVIQRNIFASTSTGAKSRKEDDTLWRLKRRVVRDKKQHFAIAEARRKTQRRIAEKERSEARDQKVRLFRSYRRGDYPDIEVPHKDLIKPLQALAQYDPQIASIIFRMTLTGLSANFTAHHWSTLSEGLSQLFENARNGPLVSALQLFLRSPKAMDGADPELVASAAISSAQQHVGIQLLETMVRREESEEEEPKEKRARISGSDRKQLCWIGLLRLHRSLGDFDSVRAILEGKLCTDSDLIKAYSAEDAQHFAEAYALYNKAIGNHIDSENEVDQVTNEVLSEARLHCLDMLGEWKVLTQTAVQHISASNPPDLDQFWNNTSDLSQLRYAIRGAVKQRIQSSKSIDEYNSIVLAAIKDWTHGKDIEKRKILERYCPVDLALVDIAEKRLEEAEVHNRFGVETFLRDWVQIGSASRRSRNETLQQSQLIREISDALQIARKGNEESYEATLQRWEVGYLPDELSSFYDIFTARPLLKKAMGSNFKSKRQSEVSMMLRSARLLSKEGNFLRAVELLEKTKSFSDEWKVSAWIVHRRNIRSESSLKIVSESLLTETTEPQVLTARALLLESVYSKELIEEISKEAQFSKFIQNQNLNNKTEHQPQLVLKIFQEAIKSIESLQTPILINPRTEFIDYLDRALRKDSKTPNYAKAFVENVLEAMRDGSARARTLFCRVLSVMEQDPDSGKVFGAKWSSVPSWMFLGWTEQIISNLSSANFGPYAVKLILKLVDDYPQALIYPLRILRDTAKENRLVNECLAKTSRKLEPYNTAADTLIESLLLLGTPKPYVQDAHAEMNLIANEGKRVKEKSEKLIRNLRRNLFLCEEDNSEILKVPLGKYWIEFRNVYRPIFDAAAKIGPGHIFRAEFWGKFHSDTTYGLQRTGWKSLKDYSPWLTQDFQRDPILVRADLEIPGQYSGEEMPNPEHHARIVTVEDRIRVFSSIQKPKVLNVRANDGQTYRFLAKAGEDLRQDARIEQLFKVMNGVLDKDKSCRDRELHLKTYDVIPLTTRTGLIQFMDIAVLKDLFHAEKEISTRAYQRLALEVLTNNKTRKIDYHWSFEHIPATRARDALIKAEKSIPYGILKRALMTIPRGPELYVQVRDQFARSFGTICAAHYLLGIGDRHLSNFMLDTRSGTAVGIDFGHAFGTATQFLPVPEMVPFRLTPQLAQVFDPIGVEGKLTPLISHTLRALRAEKQLLINVMDVFVKEPSLDWEVHAKRQFVEMELPKSHNHSSNWFPEEKLRIAKDKLDGINPVLPLVDELEHGKDSKNKSKLAKYIGIVAGDESVTKADDLREPRGFPRQNLTPDQQAKCLIDIAKDPLTRARIFSGWEPWM